MNEMKRYLRDITTLECQLHTQDRIMSDLRYRANLWGNSRQYKEPVLDTDYDEPHPLYSIALFSIIAFVGCLFVLLVVIPDSFFESELFDRISDLWLYTMLLRPFVYGYLMYRLYRYSLIKKQKQYNKRKYEDELIKYKKLIEDDMCRVKSELPIRFALENQMEQVAREREQTEKALQALYAINIIHPKYRNIVAVSSFCDYFDTGRCNSLTGNGGAYDTYEYECRFGIIITKLDVIISKLDEIIKTQYLIANLMREANHTLKRIEDSNNRMMQSMNRVEENLELTAYNTKCAAQSLAVMENIMVYYALAQ